MLGLALEGGGARGAFHMGAVKALLEAGYQFDGVAGTSIGALNGALIVQGDFEAGYRMWESLSNSLIFEVDEAQIKKVLNKKIDRETRAFLTTKIKEIIENKGIDTSRIRQLLDQIIDEDKIRRSPTDFGIVTVSVSDLKPFELYKEDIPQGKMTEYLMASANYPAFKIEPIDGKFYIDGGFYDNLPANLLVRKGYKDIVMIRTFAIGKVRKLQDEHVNTIKIMPSEDLGSILNFNHNTILTNLKLGYYDAMRAIRHLKGKKYYIEPADDDLILKWLFSIPDTTIDSMARILQIQAGDPKRMLFERIIPELSALLRLPARSTYQDILVGILECYAHEKGMDKFKIRNFTEFLEELKACDGKGEDSNHSITHGFTLRAKSRTRLAREGLINDIAAELLHVLEPSGFQ